MDTRTILFLDSGMGGLPYCQYFHRRNPGEPLVYTADRANFPYGPKDKDELAAALVSLIASLREAFRPKLAALVCNTASVSALGVLREAFPGLPFVGTVPAVKPAVMGSVSRRIGVLGTERTMADPCIGELVARYGRDCEVSALAVPELVEWVEYRHAESTAEERLKTVEPYIDYFRKQGVDALVLGCTHFLFLLDEFKLAAGPGIKVYDSMEGVSRRIEAVLDEKVLRVEHEIDATLGGGGAKGLKVPGPQSPPCLQPTASGTPLNGGAAPVTPPPGGPRPPGPPLSTPHILVVTGPSSADDVWQTRARQFGLELCTFGGPL